MEFFIKLKWGIHLRLEKIIKRSIVRLDLLNTLWAKPEFGFWTLCEEHPTLFNAYFYPEALTGNPSNVYYTDANNAGEITTATGGKAVYLHLNSSIATTQAITSVSLPGGTDLVTINGITVFDGPNGDSVVDTAALSTLINNNSSNG